MGSIARRPDRYQPRRTEGDQARLPKAESVDKLTGEGSKLCGKGIHRKRFSQQMRTFWQRLVFHDCFVRIARNE